MKVEWFWVAFVFAGAAAVLFLWIPAIVEYCQLVRRRRARKDVQHIVGAKQWWGRR